MKNAVWDKEELSTIKNIDRLLPNQPYFSKLYTGESFYTQLESLTLSPHKFKSVGDRWDIELKDGVTYASLGSEIGTLYFYQMLIRMGGYKDILELGTYVGVSTLFLAEAAKWQGSVTTVELGKEFYDIASRNIAKNGMAPYVWQIHGNAEGVMESFADNNRVFDFILIDAAKESYLELLKLSLACLSDKGVILIDDVFFQGDTLNDEPTTEKGMGVKKMLDYAEKLEGYDKVILPIGNGLMIIRKTENPEEPFYHAN